MIQSTPADSGLSTRTTNCTVPPVPPGTDPTAYLNWPPPRTNQPAVGCQLVLAGNVSVMTTAVAPWVPTLV